MFEGFSIVIFEYLSKLAQPRSLISIFALVVLAVIFIVISKRAAFNTKIIAYGAIAIAASFVLSFVKVIQFPNGGSVTVASMLPLFIFAFIAGPRAGVAAGLCYGMLQFIQEPYLVHWTQFLLDYPIAFAMLGLAGLFRKNMYAGAVAGSAGRLLCHFLSGVVFFAEYAGDQNVFLYSFLYNSSYILPDAVICMGILAISNIREIINRMSVFGTKGGVEQPH
ncbi:MAG: energy-coupled thiamine transporter ThiT [Acetivibrionales bacterium]|jgi:thiamine transporter